MLAANPVCRQKLEQQEAELAAAAAARAAAEEQLHAQQAPYHKARTEARKVRGAAMEGLNMVRQHFNNSTKGKRLVQE